MTKLALKHPILSGLTVWIATTSAIFGLGFLWVNYVTIPRLVEAQGNTPGDVAGMGALAAFTVLIAGSLILGILAGIISSVVLFIFKRKAKKKP